MEEKTKVAEISWNGNYREAVFAAFDLIKANLAIAQQSKIILKPNLVTTSPPPCTTDVRCVEAVVEYCQKYSQAEIIVAEGSGGSDTSQAYQKLGYQKLAQKHKVKLVDLDQEKVVLRENPSALVYKKIYLPEIILDGFLISIPVLKDHSITKTTLCLKNLVGCLPAKYYSGYWSYKKSQIHREDENRVIFDLATYRRPDLCLIDAAIGQKECHLSGPPCSPPKNLILASFDPFAIDARGSEILGWRKEQIGYLTLKPISREQQRKAGAKDDRLK